MIVPIMLNGADWLNQELSPSKEHVYNDNHALGELYGVYAASISIGVGIAQNKLMRTACYKGQVHFSGAPVGSNEAYTGFSRELSRSTRVLVIGANMTTVAENMRPDLPNYYFIDARATVDSTAFCLLYNLYYRLSESNVAFGTLLDYLFAAHPNAEVVFFTGNYNLGNLGTQRGMNDLQNLPHFGEHRNLMGKALNKVALDRISGKVPETLILCDLASAPFCKRVVIDKEYCMVIAPEGLCQTLHLLQIFQSACFKNIKRVLLISNSVDTPNISSAREPYHTSALHKLEATIESTAGAHNVKFFHLALAAKVHPMFNFEHIFIIESTLSFSGKSAFNGKNVRSREHTCYLVTTIEKIF